MNTLLIACPSTGGEQPAMESWQSTASGGISCVIDDTVEGEGAGWLQKIQRVYEEFGHDILAYFHSDLFILEPGWNDMVLREFEDPDVAVAGFFGATGIGSERINVEPYHPHLLARYNPISNMVNAEEHGGRVIVPCDVAVLDSLSMIVRRSFLDEVGGWPVDRYPPSHCSDMWICLTARRHRRKVRFIPVNISHNGGGVRGDGRFDYPEWIAGTQWKSDAECHRIGHQLIYDDFHDLLPFVVGG